jgi:hypothetical protein
MLGKTLHIPNSAFRMLPNPTPYYWDKNFFDLRQLVKEYRKRIDDSDHPLLSLDQQLVDDTHRLVQTLDRDKKSQTPGYSMPLLDILHDILDGCDVFLRQSIQDLVWIVIREHFQEVLKLINAEEDITDKDDGSVEIRNQQMGHFGALTAAGPELRQEVFMELYFYKVLEQVRGRAVILYRRLRATQYAPDSGDLDAPGLDTSNRDTPSLEVQASTIWCTLILRMMCWLLLHDFHEKDVQIPKSELLGSRLPVYIV